MCSGRARILCFSRSMYQVAFIVKIKWDIQDQDDKSNIQQQKTLLSSSILVQNNEPY